MVLPTFPTLAAQERGEIARQADGPSIRDHVRDADKMVPPTLSDIGAELVAAQDRGEVATQSNGGANVPNGVRASDTVAATLPDIGIPRQRAIVRGPDI